MTEREKPTQEEDNGNWKPEAYIRPNRRIVMNNHYIYNLLLMKRKTEISEDASGTYAGISTICGSINL